MKIGQWGGGGRGVIAALLGATVLVFLPLFQSLSRQYTDFGAHLEFAASLIRTGSTSLPHFVFEYGVAFFYALGLSLTQGAVLLSLIAMVSTAGVIFLIIKGDADPPLAALLSFALLLVGPLSLITLPDLELYLGYMTPNVYHNPTLILLKPIALGLLILGSRAFDRGVEEPRWGIIALAAMLSVFSCLTKPSFQIAFLPGLGLLTALAIVRREEVDLRLCVLGVAIPSFVVLGWQYSVGFGQVRTSEIFFAPLQVIGFLADRVFLKLFLSVVFPVLVTALFFRDAFRDKRLMIAWSTAIFGLLYAYLLAESGSRFSHGNFLWSGYIGISVLYVACIPVLLRQGKSSSQLLCWGVFSLQVLSGGVFAFSQALGEQYLRYW